MALKYVLLTMLSRERKTGYEIAREFESSVGYFWSASHQQVYRELGKLSDDGLLKFALVEQGDKPDKKIYRITAGGKRELHSWLEKPITDTPTKDVLLVKLLNTNDHNVELILTELKQALERASVLIKVYLNIEKTHYPSSVVSSLVLEDLALYLTLRKGITSLKSHISWLKEAHASIQMRKSSS